MAAVAMPWPKVAECTKVVDLIVLITGAAFSQPFPSRFSSIFADLNPIPSVSRRGDSPLSSSARTASIKRPRLPGGPRDPVTPSSVARGQPT